MAMAETEPVVEKRCGQNCETIGRRRAGENFAPDKIGERESGWPTLRADDETLPDLEVHAVRRTAGWLKIEAQTHHGAT